MKDFKKNQNRDVSWALVLTATTCFAPILYAASSGPMKIGFEMLGKTAVTHDRVYAPLVWLKSTTPANGAINWYWKQFRTNEEIEVDPLGEWLYSPEARAINRNLGVSN